LRKNGWFLVAIDLQRCFKADESYYIRNESIVRKKREIDLLVDPRPDLVIEIEMSRSAINKLSVFASIGIPEVWRCFWTHFLR